MLTVIQRADVMPLLLDACPSFTEGWQEAEAENADDESAGGRLFYMDAAAFIRHLVALRLAGETTEFPAVFDVIDRLVLECDPYVQNLAVIGYLEGFQMMTVTAAGLDPELHFRPWLRPKSEEWWQRFNRLWDGDPAALVDGDEGA